MSADPYEILAGSPLPEVTRDRVLTLLTGTELAMSATAQPDDGAVVVARLNDLDWVISVEDELVRLECVLPTQLDAEVVSLFHVLCNEFNSSAFDGRALVGTAEGMVELRGDACFVTAVGMTDDQLFHALNLGIISAQEALLSVLDTFNDTVRGLAGGVPGDEA
ncbi:MULTISPECIES: YbjN domain-containing protein [unclassified Corynebacterium]|uniref:YbjN domain-containing protein n=1 Tax=unclassified Corynebacterium TaxID=2624378 RepID=UPI0008A3877B|nr:MULTISPECIES: YbjN domain-containing protein [unclassified Corynebacterium]MCQ9677088.1 YbjN domain-containing protein [Corynebacterium sp. BF-R-2]OFT62780.1 hypothetical protein HMPREF3149_03230 [Corynebacterium sp. HMSC05E07]